MKTARFRFRREGITGLKEVKEAICVKTEQPPPLSRGKGYDSLSLSAVPRWFHTLIQMTQVVSMTLRVLKIKKVQWHLWDNWVTDNLPRHANFSVYLLELYPTIPSGAHFFSPQPREVDCPKKYPVGHCG